MYQDEDGNEDGRTSPYSEMDLDGERYIILCHEQPLVPESVYLNHIFLTHVQEAFAQKSEE